MIFNLLNLTRLKLGLIFRPKRGSKRDIALANLFRKMMKDARKEIIDNIDLDTKEIKIVPII